MRSKTPSFVTTIKLAVTPQEEVVLNKRFNAGTSLYNAILGESLKRLDLMRQSKAYDKARKMPKGKERTELFKTIRQRYHFSDYDLQAFAIKTKNSCFIGDHLDTHTVQKISKRAFDAVNMYCFGKRGRPRFKSHRRGIQSVEGKSNDTGIRFRDGIICWKDLKLRALIDKHDPVIQHGLNSPIKFNRIVRKKIRGKVVFYVQLVCEGLPYVKEKNKEHTTGVVGADVNVSSVAVVSETKAELHEFASGIKDKQREIRLIQRQMDRQKRVSNPDNYNPDGTVKKGAKNWVFSKGYIANRDKLAELKRKEASHRKSENNRVVNEVLKMGDTFQLEDLNKKGWQKKWGKSVGRRGPGGFETTLISKAERAGCKVVKFPTRTTKLSRTCICGKVEPKSLNDRWHICECGVIAQRDLFSAFLARFVYEDRLDIPKAFFAWVRAEPLLWEAMSSLKTQLANGKALPPSFGVNQRQSQSLPNPSIGPIEAGNVVARDLTCESSGEVGNQLGTPCL